MELLGGLMGLAGAGINAAATIKANRDNIEMQRETNRLNEVLMREGWSREDNATQRKVTDLKAAGLSPLLAGGNAAASSGPVNMKAPEERPVDWGLQQVLPAIVQGMQIKKTQADINAQAQQLELQARGQDLQKLALDQTYDLKMQELGRTDQEIARKRDEFNQQKLRDYRDTIREIANNELTNARAHGQRIQNLRDQNDFSFELKKGLRQGEYRWAEEKPMHDTIGSLLGGISSVIKGKGPKYQNNVY